MQFFKKIIISFLLITLLPQAVSFACEPISVEAID
ncbi:Uncharacterised protein [Mammaliicoccus stepanovicii]|uniref:Uncharacterized protein n=1 Tax=Mammaliicoccus stepanovicii TaxID=643214 RepID=A0A239YXX2_9STAP|nr:Uncharacterised protein [Mammaliicoccus stepanovicii]